VSSWSAKRTLYWCCFTSSALASSSGPYAGAHPNVSTRTRYVPGRGAFRMNVPSFAVRLLATTFCALSSSATRAQASGVLLSASTARPAKLGA
jgi:hypothetical protein